MSVIIRLQNLPWSANAADIRAYFSGLSIPEGGVHIVGGEQGDAFIAFSTDEDARQAMLLDGGKLKEIKIKLFLSSRTEMLKIIEQARQQAIKLQTLIANPQSSQPLPQSNQGVSGNDETKETQETGYRVKDKDDDSNSRRDRKDRSSSRDRGRVRGRSKEGDRSRDRSRGRDRRDRERDRRRRDRSRSRDRYRNRRSRSRDRKRGPRGESKDDHRGGRHSRDSDVEKNDTSCSKNEGNQSWEVQQQTPPQQHPKPALLPDPPLPQMLLQMQQNGKDPAQSTMPQSGVNFPADQERRHFPGHPQMPPMGNFPGMPPMRGREGWPPMAGPMGPMPVPLDPSQMPLQRPPLLMPDMPLSTFPPPVFPAMYSAPSSHAEGFDPMWRMMAQHSESNHDSSTADADACVEIRGLPLNVSYIDLKKLFDGLIIPLDGIKMINDNQGNRTGIAYVKFSNASQKKSALNQHGKKVRSNIVEVMHLRDDLFRAAVDNFKPEKDAIVKAVDMDIDNGESNDVVWPKDNRRDRGRERKFQDPYRINPALDYKRQDPRQEGRQDPRSGRGERTERPDRSEREPRPDRMDRMDNQDRMDRPDRMDRSDRQERMGRMDRQQDRMDRLEVSNSVLIKGLPPQCSERDILDFFSELGVAPLNIHLLQDNVGQSSHSEAYCQFETDEEADKSVSKNGANMGRFVVSVEKVSQDQFLRATGQWKLPVPYQQNPMPPLLPLPPQYHQYRMGHEEKGSDRPSYGNDERYQKGDKGNRGNYGMNERYNSRMGGDSGGGGNMRGRGGEGRGGLRGRSRFSAGPPPLLGNGGGDPSMSGPMGGPRPPRGGGGGGPGPGPGPGGPYIDGDVVENFGKPGCVVALENLHFRADIEEIIGLFNDFEVEHEDVIRRFDDRGRPTGDARVCLKNPSEAMRAVRQLAYTQLRGRTIKVSLLQ